MEDYEDFVQHRLSELGKDTEEEYRETASPSSLILFYGRAILPPLLSEKRREEMQLYRQQVRKEAVERKGREDPRMAYVQTILHSVQLRKTPTLEELLLEERHGGRSAETKDRVCLQSFKETSGVSLPPLTSTVCSAFLSSETPTHEQSLIDKLDSQPVSQPSSFSGTTHQSLSSGYMTFDNVEDTKSAFDRVGVENQESDLKSSEGGFNFSGFFLHSSSNTVAKIPDIINHPPIDGDELERSGLETSFSHCFISVKEINDSSFWEDSVTYDHVLAERSESTSLNEAEHQEEIQTSPKLNRDKVGNLDQNEDSFSFSLSEKGSVSDNPDISQTLSDHNQKTEPIHNPEDDSDSTPSVEPYRLSLQALLKKSQEYRRQQRLLRNQARNSRIQDRNKEQPRANTDEQSHSDKENDGSHQKDKVTALGRKVRQSSGNSAFISSDSCLKTSRENEEIKESGLILGSKKGVEEDTNFKNQQNISQEVRTRPTQSAIIQQHSSSTGVSPSQDAFCSLSAEASNRAGGKYGTVPTPNISKSPVCFKSSSKEGAKTQEGAVSTVKHFGSDHRVIPHLTAWSTDKCVIEGVSSESPQHMDVLESNLSGLKVLISDLESTVRENLHSQCQTENKRSDFSVEDIQHSEHYKPLASNVCDNWEVTHSDDGGDYNDDCTTWRRQSINAVDEGLLQDLTEAKRVSLQVTEKEPETDYGTSLGESSTKEHELSEEMGKGDRSIHGSYRNQQIPAKSSLSVAQWMRIPEIFRNVSPETSSPCDVSVLSDCCNLPVELREEVNAEDHDSTHSTSLNQSYDVDTPSGLWFQEEPGSNPSSQNCLVPVQHLTPEADHDLQRGVSKVKRRLTLHPSEGVQENNPERPGLRHASNNPRAEWTSWEGHGDLKDKQEQLKRTHAAQLRALQEEHRKQQEELLQVLSAHYRLLQSVSLPRSKSSSQLGDTLTFSAATQTFGSASQRHRSLLAAVVKGFLTRRLLRTERAAQLVRTIRDTQHFLQAFKKQQQMPGRQDVVLLERVTLQLRAARYEVYDIFFSLSVREKMQLISRDRELHRERALRRLSGADDRLKGKGSLSAATKKSLERKRGVLIQKKATESHSRFGQKTGGKTGLCAEQPLESRQPHIQRNPQRVSRTSQSPRPR